jgi:hypothetical protein
MSCHAISYNIVSYFISIPNILYSFLMSLIRVTFGEELGIYVVYFGHCNCLRLCN